MAIEFNCPYCTATMRVPDEFAGRKGSCPKCRTKLLVPVIGPAAGALHNPEDPADDQLRGAQRETQTDPARPAPHTATPPAAASPAPSPRPGEGPATASAPPGQDVASASAAAADPPVADIPLPPMDVFSASAPPSGSAVGRSLRKKTRRRKSQRIYAIAIPLTCFVLFAVVVGYLMFGRPVELKGSLRGTVASKLDIPPASVPLADFDLTAAERSTVADAFAERPEAFVSSLMSCQISSEQNRLQIKLKLTDKTWSWFAVNPTLDVNLQNWIQDHRMELNQLRLSRIADTGTALCRDKLTKAAGNAVAFDAARYRDEFGFAAQVDAFGFAVEAIAGQRRALCAYQDRNGILYFALPSDTTEFKLRGRTLALPQPLFPGEYRVVVQENPATMSESTAGSEPDSSDTPEHNALDEMEDPDTMSDDGMPAPSDHTGPATDDDSMMSSPMSMTPTPP